jgi:DNA-binding transcriptional regulator YiaG
MTENDKTVWWLPADGAALKQARSSTEMSRADFARALSISEKQLTELEEGGSSAFYSERIKYQAGLRILGYFDLLTQKEEELKENAASAKAMAEAQKKETIAQLDGVIETNKRDLAPETHQPPKVFQVRNGYVLGAVLVVAITYAVMFIPDLQTSTKANEAKNTAASAPTPQSPVTQQPASVSLASTPSASAEQMGAVPAKTETVFAPLICDWSGTPMPLTPIAAARPADRVHLVANSDLQLCLKDSAGQERVIKLEAGDRQTFYGSGAPWLIYSPQMVSLKVFFQGYHVFIPKEDTNFVKLEARF